MDGLSTLISLSDLALWRQKQDEQRHRIAFVPTMGALHAGHLSLVSKARELADTVIVSIFVNPLQFGPNEDYGRYPRTLKADIDLLNSLNVEAVFVPNAAAMYLQDFQTKVSNEKMSSGLCGSHRPGHFDGVLTVVLKLFNLVRPHCAIFGKKDYQQWRLIGKMALDLNLPVEVIGCQTLREKDGLAMSSRNRYLSPDERNQAQGLFLGLHKAEFAFHQGERKATKLTEIVSTEIVAKGLVLEYAEVRRQIDLTEFTGSIDAPSVMLVAAKAGTTRLIDNLELREKPS